MGFKNGAYATVWKVENKGKYTVGQVSTSKKNKENGSYETDFKGNFVKFVGEANNVVEKISGRTRIKILDCDVTNKYDKNKNREFVNYTVFKCEMVSQESDAKGKSITTGTCQSNDEDLPF